jgi:hypothetical protein
MKWQASGMFLIACSCVRKSKETSRVTDELLLAGDYGVVERTNILKNIGACREGRIESYSRLKP